MSLSSLLSNFTANVNTEAQVHEPSKHLDKIKMKRLNKTMLVSSGSAEGGRTYEASLQLQSPSPLTWQGSWTPSHLSFAKKKISMRKLKSASNLGPDFVSLSSRKCTLKIVKLKKLIKIQAEFN